MSDSPVPYRERLRGAGWVVALLVLAGFAAPLALFQSFFGGLPTVTPAEARFMLRGGEAALLVDVRGLDAFAARHLDGAVNWPLSAITATTQAEDIPPHFRRQTLLMLCDVGWDSRAAVAHLARLGHPRVFQVRGGMQEWIHDFTADLAFEQNADKSDIPPGFAGLPAVIAPQGKPYDRFVVASGRVEELPFRLSPLAEQVLAVAAFFVIKPIYELLSLAVIVVLWRSREADLTALRWAMIFFFVGENACAVNYFAFRESSYLLEYLHSYGMVLSLGFAAYAVLEGVDRRLVFFSDTRQRCAALALCGNCERHADAPCGLKRTFYVLIPALMAIAVMLPTADWHNTAYNTAVFGRLYNYGHLWIYQVFENWCCAATAVALLAASLSILLAKKEDAVAWAKIVLAAGVGPLGFGMLRMILGAAYDRNRVWFLFWEETTELLFIAGICLVLWIFRASLLPRLGAFAPKNVPRE